MVSMRWVGLYALKCTFGEQWIPLCTCVCVLDIRTWWGFVEAILYAIYEAAFIVVKHFVCLIVKLTVNFCYESVDTSPVL